MVNSLSCWQRWAETLSRLFKPSPNQSWNAGCTCPPDGCEQESGRKSVKAGKAGSGAAAASPNPGPDPGEGGRGTVPAILPSDKVALTVPMVLLVLIMLIPGARRMHHVGYVEGYP